jgi:hypothetical protein
VAESTNPYRAFAEDAHAMYHALLDVGFAADQATALLCQIVAQPSPQQTRRSPAGLVEALLDGAKQKAARSPVDDRMARIWQKPPTTPPPGTETPEPQPAPEGAPAHE